ncbi:hypothetical protein Bca52824_017318 [Brassica carinata]|uniref:Uncharacterized protein n=1 Tax=Brassica carinata TaxID=52824 RepID=A0A8X7VMW7_BRACI|nr:hypothetical protein Bca52824_017318 [Brassica carinata]
MGIENQLIILVHSLEPMIWFTKVGFLCFLGEKFWPIQQEVHEGNCIVQRAWFCVDCVIPSNGVWHRWKNKIEICGVPLQTPHAFMNIIWLLSVVNISFDWYLPLMEGGAVIKFGFRIDRMYDGELKLPSHYIVSFRDVDRNYGEYKTMQVMKLFVSSYKRKYSCASSDNFSGRQTKKKLFFQSCNNLLKKLSSEASEKKLTNPMRDTKLAQWSGQTPELGLVCNQRRNENIACSEETRQCRFLRVA